MNMHGSKDGCLVVLLLLASVLDAGGFFISQRSATKVVNDETFIVVCRDDVSGLPITWRGAKGVVLGPKTRPMVHTTSYGTSIIFASPLKLEDTGNYTCSTEQGEKAVFHFLVEPPLKFTDTATNQTGVEGREFIIKCEVKGGTVSWSVDNDTIITDDHKFTVLGDGLLIKNVSRTDSKTYICKGVQQSTGTVLDRKIHLHVLHKPVHPFHPPKHVKQDVVYGYINGTINLTCTVVANPPASFQWLKSNDKKQKMGKIISESEQVSILQLHIDNSTFGEYKCTAKNKYGIYEERFLLKRGVKPQVPSDVQLKRITPKALVFKIREPEKTEGAETESETRGFSAMYKKIDEEEWKQTEFNITQDNIYTLDNLESNAEYEVQVATRNAAGLSDYVPPLRYKTSRAGAPNPTLSILVATTAAILFQKFWALW